MFGLTGGHADDPALTEEGQGKFEIVCRVVAEHLRCRPMIPEVAARAYALWCAVHGHAFLILDGKADKPRSAWMKTPIFALRAVPICPRSTPPPDQVVTGSKR
jgi:hypothetical protein